MEHDLTTGSVPGQLIRFSVPILLSNLLQSCYSLVDMAVVGRFVGSDGLAAVSSAAMICYIITAVCTGITMGGAVLVAQYKGQGDKTAQTETVGTLFSLSCICSIVVTLLGLLLYRPVVSLMQVPPDAVPHAEAYLMLAVSGTVFIFGYNAVCSVLRGLGDSKGPLCFVAVAAAVNIALDLLLVGVFGWGVRGAALATVCAQALSFLTATLYLRHMAAGLLRLQFASRRARLILRIGFPSAVQMGVLNLSYLLVTGMFNTYGVAVAAAAGIGLKVNTAAAMPCWAVGAAVTTMAGQCVGKGDLKRAVSTAKAGLVLSVASSLLTMLAVQVFAAPIVRLFDQNPAVVSIGVDYLRICCSLNCLVYGAMYLYDSFATGVGAAGLAMVNSLLQSVVFRILFSILLSMTLGWGYWGLFWAESLSPLIPGLIGGLFFHTGIWRRKRLTDL